MATSTYIPLATTTLTASAASVTFGSIPQDYRDLVLVISGKMTPTDAFLELYINNDTTTSNYSVVTAFGNGSTTASQSFNDNDFVNLDSSQSMAIVQFMDYSATDKHKTILGRSSGDIADMRAMRWANTSAITTFYLEDAQGDDFSSGTTFSLYGIAS